MSTHRVFPAVVPYLCLFLLPLYVKGSDTFTLENTHPTNAVFRFYSYEYRDVVRPSDLPISSENFSNVTLRSSQDHFLQFFSDGGAKTNVGKINFRREIARQGNVISLSTLYRTENRVRERQVMRYRSEQRTRSINVTTYSIEARTRQLTCMDPYTGCRNSCTHVYYVRVPRLETREQSYTVQVPYTEIVQQRYTVLIIDPTLSVIVNGKKRMIRPTPAPEPEALKQRARPFVR